MNPIATYWITLVLIIVGSSVAGYALGRHHGYVAGAVDGYDGCLEEYFDDNGELRRDAEILEAEEIS